MRTKIAALLALVFCLLASVARAEKAPANANLLDVTRPEFGAIPDDGLDDYPAIKRAMGFVDGFTGNTLYFPCGTYNFHETVEWRDWPTVINPSVPISVFATSGTPPNQVSGYLWTIGIPWQGEDRDCVTIKLDDNATGFGDPNTPKSFLITGSLVGPQSNLKGLTGGLGGAGAYQNWFSDLTIDCGSGNPGVRCIDWIANNAGEIYRVKIKTGDGQGLAGVYMGRGWPGPAMIMNSTIEGFGYGIQLLQFQYSMTFLNVTLTNQHTAGFYLAANMATMEKMTISEDTDIPAIVQADGGAQLAVLNSVLTGPGGGVTHSAIETVAGAKFYLENVETTGYAAALKVGAVVQEAGPTIAQAQSRVPFKIFNAPDKSLDIPVEYPPEPYMSDPDVHPEEWANVIDYGAGPGFGGETNNDVSFIQAAFNSGKPIIYFPKNPDRLGRPAGFDSIYAYKGPTITVPATVRRVFFYRNGASMLDSAYPTSNDCVFTVIGEATDPPVEFNYWRGATRLTAGRHFCNKSNGRTMVLRNSPSGESQLLDGPGKTFLIDTISHFDAKNGAQVFAWQYNQEIVSLTSTIVTGSVIEGAGTKVRVIGEKTEGDHTAGLVKDGAMLKMIGGFFFPCIGRTFPNVVLSNGFEITNAQASLSFLEFCSKSPSNPGYVWENAVIQTIGSSTRTLRSDRLVFSPNCCSNRNYMPLMNAYPNSDVTIIPKLEDGPASVTIPYGPRFWSYRMVQVDPLGVDGINMDPGMWTQPAECQGASSVTMTVNKTGSGAVDFDLYSCQNVSGGPAIGTFDPSTPWTIAQPKNCRNLTSDVVIDGVGVADGTAADFTYSEPVGKLLVSMRQCTGDCTGSVQLQCTKQ